MRLSVASAALVAALVLTPAAPALSQDFSITNQVEPADPGRRDLMRQLQAWWDVHAYYPKHASNNDEGGTVKIHLRVLPDGRIWMLDVVEGSGSRSLDAAAASAFRGGFVRPFPEGAPEASVDVSLHYVLAHRHNQPVDASYTPASSKSAFTITNEPVKSPMLEALLQRTCTGTVARKGMRGRPWLGVHSWAQATFFRKPDGTLWVKFYEEGYPSLSPVTQLGNMLQWVGREDHLPKDGTFWTQWTVWPDGANHLSGAEGSPIPNDHGAAYSTGLGGPVDLTCATDVSATMTWSDWSAQTMVTPPGDPP